MAHQKLSFYSDSPTQPTILCVGTTPALQRVMIFDGIKSGGNNDAQEAYESAAGKCINVAKVVHDLGARARLCTIMGGKTGKFLKTTLTRMGVRHDVVESMHATRICTTIIDRTSKTLAELIEESPEVSAVEMEELWIRIISGMKGASVLVLSGSLAPGVPTDFYAQCISLANQMGIQTIVDAQGEPLMLALEEGPTLIKPNRDELVATLGRPFGTPKIFRAGLKKLLVGSPTWAAITAGREGVSLTDGKRFWDCRPPEIQVMNAIGSGDSFAAGAAVAMAGGATMPEAMRMGIACGCANALNLEPGRVEPEDVRRLLEETNLMREVGR